MKVFYNVTEFSSRFMHLLLFIGVARKNLVSENDSFCLEKSGKMNSAKW